MSHPVMPFPAACSGRFPPRGAWHVLASPPQVSGANRAAGASPRGWGLGSTNAGCGTERVLTVTPVGTDLAVPGLPCAPLAWAPMETAPFPQPAGGWVSTLPQRRSSLCQPPSPPVGCQAGGPQSCARGSLAPPGCQGAGHSPPPPIPPAPQRGQPPASPGCPGWEGTLGTPMGTLPAPCGAGRWEVREICRHLASRLGTAAGRWSPAQPCLEAGVLLPTTDLHGTLLRSCPGRRGSLGAAPSPSTPCLHRARPCMEGQIWQGGDAHGANVPWKWHPRAGGGIQRG